MLCRRMRTISDRLIIVRLISPRWKLPVVDSVSRTFCPSVLAPLERQMRRQLQESVAADGLLDYSVVVRIPIRGQRRCAETGLRIEAWVEFEVAVRSVETGVVEDVERI